MADQPAQPTDLVNYLNDPGLQQAQGQFNTAQTAATQATSDATSLPALLKSALAAKFGEDNPLIQQRADASTAYFNSIPSSYNDVLPANNNGVVLSPTQQAMMIAAKQNAYLAPVIRANSLISSQSGNLIDLIDRVSAAQKSKAELAQGSATLAHQNWQDIMNTLSEKAKIALEERAQGLTQNRFNFDIQGGLKGLAQKQLTAELEQGGKTGISLKDSLAKYGNRLTPDEIYAIYNDSSGRGRAIENSAKLSDLGIKPTTQSQLQDTFETTTGVINNILDQYAGAKTNPFLGGLLKNIPLTEQHRYEQQRQGLSVALKDISGAGAGSGVRVTQAELDKWANLLPKVNETYENNRKNIISLDNNLKAKFHGKGLDSSYLKQFGITSPGSSGRPPLSSFEK